MDEYCSLLIVGMFYGIVHQEEEARASHEGVMLASQ
jgi:hypothetical protein